MVSQTFDLMFKFIYVFWEGHKILRNLYLTFVLWSASQKLGEDFAKFSGLLRIYELYLQLVCTIYVHRRCTMYRVSTYIVLIPIWKSHLYALHHDSDKNKSWNYICYVTLMLRKRINVCVAITAWNWHRINGIIII